MYVYNDYICILMCVCVPNPRETKVYAQHVMHTFGYVHARQTQDDYIVLSPGPRTNESYQGHSHGSSLIFCGNTTLLLIPVQEGLGP